MQHFTVLPKIQDVQFVQMSLKSIIPFYELHSFFKYLISKLEEIETTIHKVSFCKNISLPSSANADAYTN